MSNTVLRLFNRKRIKPADEISAAKEIWALSTEVSGYKGRLIRVVRTNDNAELDIYADKDGYLDTATLLNHAGANTCEVMLIAGQKGFSDATATIGKRPKIVDSGTLVTENGTPAMLFDGINDCFSATIPYASSDSEVSFSFVATRNSLSGHSFLLGSDPTYNAMQLYSLSGRNDILFGTERPSMNILSGSSLGIINTTRFITINASRKSLEKRIYSDGLIVSTAPDIDVDFTSATQVIIGSYTLTSAYACKGTMQFIGCWIKDTSYNQLELYDNIDRRYNISGSNTDPVETIGDYFSDVPEYLPNKEYANGRLTGKINFSEFINFFAWTNLPSSKIGNIDIVNIDSEYNSLVTGDYNYLEILESADGVLTSFSRSQVKNIGYIENGRIRVTPKPVQEILNHEIPSGLFDATYPNLENEKKLLTLGACDLVAPKILDATTNVYFIADNIYNVVAVYDRGISVIFTQTIDGFVLSANPNGKILCHVQGLSDGSGSYEKHISQHIPRLLDETGVDYNATDLTTIHPAIDSAWAGTNESVLTAISVLLKSFNAYHYFESDGTLRFGKLQNPTTPTDTLDEIEIIGEVKAFKDTASLLSEKLLNDPNFNQYSESEIVYSAIESEKINFVKKYKVTTVGTGLHEFYKNNNPEMPTNSLGGQTTGQVILDERIALWSQLRFFYTLSTTRVFNMNQVITLTNSLKGLELGKNALVIGKELNRETNKIDYWMWG